MYLIDYIIFNFILYSFIGWVIEITYNYFINSSFKKEGFLKGPYKPMYGIAVTILIVFKEVFQLNKVFLLISCFIIPSVVEYLSGYLLKKFFDECYWDYSELKYNLDGIVTLKFSIYWTVLSLIGINIFQPFIYKIMFIRFYKLTNILSYIFLFIFSVDVFYTITSKLIKKKQIAR